MAEVFGIAAGAIGVVSLSIQLAESLQKVKGFYAAVKNAPPQVEELIEEIEIMQDILSDLESGSQSANVASSKTMQRCMKVAQRATKTFSAFSSELQNRVKKSRFRGGVKFALTRDEIKQMLNQLERAKSSLNMAYDMYREAIAEDRHAALLSVVSSSQGVAVGTVQNAVILGRSLSQVSRHSIRSERQLIQIKTPEWLSTTIWQFEMRRSITGLNIMLRTYGVIPWDAPIYEACANGDTVEMQRLFDNRLASPFDRDENGFSLWEMTASFSSVKSLRFLDQFDAASGVDVSHKKLTWLMLYFGVGTRIEQEPLLDVGRRLREDMIWLHDIDLVCDSDDVDAEHPISLNIRRATRLRLCSPEEADSIWFWQSLETAVTSRRTTPSEEFIRDMLNRYMPEHHGGHTPMQLAAVATAFALAWKDSDNIECLEEIVAAMIANGVPLHEGDHHRTPLLLFIATFLGSSENFYMYGFGSKPRVMQRGLVRWLKMLQRNGVDLLSYGAEESRLHVAHRALNDPVPLLAYWHNLERLNFSDDVAKFSFTYGSTPKDWTVQLEHPIDQYVGDFWQMPGLLDEDEIPAMRPIPGGWIDEV